MRVSFACDGAKSSFRKFQFYLFKREKLFILLRQRVSRLRKNTNERLLIKLIERCDDRKSADEFRDQAILEKVFRLNERKQFSKADVVPAANVGSKSHRLTVQALFDNLFESDECPAADEENIRRIDLNEFLMRVLASSLGGDVGNRSFNELEKRLLHPFTGYITRDRWAIALAADFVDFVDVDDPAFGTFDVIVRCLEQFEDDIFDILSDITGLRESGRIGQSEGHIEILGQGLGQ